MYSQPQPSVLLYKPNQSINTVVWQERIKKIKPKKHKETSCSYPWFCRYLLSQHLFWQSGWNKHLIKSGRRPFPFCLMEIMINVMKVSDIFHTGVFIFSHENIFIHTRKSQQLVKISSSKDMIFFPPCYFFELWKYDTTCEKTHFTS